MLTIADYEPQFGSRSAGGKRELFLHNSQRLTFRVIGSNPLAPTKPASALIELTLLNSLKLGCVGVAFFQSLTLL